MDQDEMLHEYNKLQGFRDSHELRFVLGQWTDLHPSLNPTEQLMVLVSLGSWDGQEDERDARIFYYTDGDQLKRGETICDGDFTITEMWNQKGQRVQTIKPRRS